MTSLRTGLVTLAALSLAEQLHAAQRSPSRVDELRVAKEKLSRSADQTKGGARQLILQERRRVGDLIEDLESGRSVDPAEIDRAVERANRPLP